MSMVAHGAPKFDPISTEETPLLTPPAPRRTSRSRRRRAWLTHLRVGHPGEFRAPGTTGGPRRLVDVKVPSSRVYIFPVVVEVVVLVTDVLLGLPKAPHYVDCLDEYPGSGAQSSHIPSRKPALFSASPVPTTRCNRPGYMMSRGRYACASSAGSYRIIRQTTEGPAGRRRPLLGASRTTAGRGRCTAASRATSGSNRRSRSLEAGADRVSGQFDVFEWRPKVAGDVVRNLE